MRSLCEQTGMVRYQGAPTPPRATAGASLAAALMATVPGIDANDPPKSLAVFRDSYAIVLSSLAQLPVWRRCLCEENKPSLDDGVCFMTELPHSRPPLPATFDAGLSPPSMHPFQEVATPGFPLETEYLGGGAAVPRLCRHLQPGRA